MCISLTTGSKPFFTFRMKKCVTCKHSIDVKGASHDWCRTHALCAQSPQYSSLGCTVCEDLLDRAVQFEDPLAAKDAFTQLSDWVEGFVRNSKNRPAGMDVFFFPEERDDFETITVLLWNIDIILQWDEEDTSRPRKSAMVMCSSDSDSPQASREWLLRSPSCQDEGHIVDFLATPPGEDVEVIGVGDIEIGDDSDDLVVEKDYVWKVDDDVVGDGRPVEGDGCDHSFKDVNIVNKLGDGNGIMLDPLFVLSLSSPARTLLVDCLAFTGGNYPSPSATLY